MTQITIAEWLSTTTPKTTTTGASMATYSFQPLTKAHRTADYYLDTWIATMQDRLNIDTIWGRIIRTNINYIVTGYNFDGNWIEIPCANLNTAKLYLGHIMSEDEFKAFTQLEKDRRDRTLKEMLETILNHSF